MKITENIEALLAEIAVGQGFINIDKSDVDGFKAAVDEIDAEKVSGLNEEIGVILNNAISSISQSKAYMHLSRLLLVIRVAENNDLMQHISDLYDVFDALGGDVSYQWGISTVDYLEPNQFELILAVGFKK